MNERPLSAPEAEQGVIGALLLKPELCESIGAFLSGAYFHDGDLGCLYGLALQCHSKGIKPDIITLSDRSERLPSGESTMYVAGTIQGGVQSAANAMTYARVVVERYHARRLFEAGQAIMELATTRGRIGDQLAESQQLLMGLGYEDEEPDVVNYNQAAWKSGSLFSSIVTP